MATETLDLMEVRECMCGPFTPLAMPLGTPPSGTPKMPTKAPQDAAATHKGACDI